MTTGRTAFITPDDAVLVAAELAEFGLSYTAEELSNRYVANIERSLLAQGEVQAASWLLDFFATED